MGEDRPGKKAKVVQTNGKPKFAMSSFLTHFAPSTVASSSSSSSLPKALSNPNSTSGLSDHASLSPTSKPKAKVQANAGAGTGSSSNVTKKAKGKGKATEVIVIDDDDEEEEGEDDSAMWVDKYAPQSRDDLGVHPKKIADVSHWLEEAFDLKRNKYRKILVLSGPSGSAKTATLRVLAKEAGVDILEYGNGSNHEFAGDVGRESIMQQLPNFLARAAIAPALDFATSSFPSTSTQAPPPSSARNRLILLEDLPNTSHYPTKLALREALHDFLASPRTTCPLVIVISEALVRPGIGGEAELLTGEGRGESLDARSVLGSEILYAPACREIQFNPIAVTIMKKALVKILERAYPLPADRPSVGTLELLIAHANGDIRSALMSLEFLASEGKGKRLTKFGGGGAGGGRKRKSDGSGMGAPSGEAVKKLLQFVTARESSLFIFHALGKVLYSKRWGVSADDDKKDVNRSGIRPLQLTDKLPRHLRAEWDRKPSKVDPDMLFAEAPVDSDVFLSYVQHNYTQFTNEIEECLGIAEGISVSDSLMRLEGDGWLRRAPLTSQYSFSLAVRSTLIFLPSPVPHRKQVLKKSALWDKMKLAKANEDKARGLMARRTTREVWSDWAPFLGKMGDGVSHNQAFWKQIATFPPVPGGKTSVDVGGALLEEKEVLDDGEDTNEEEWDAEEKKMEVDPVEKDQVLWDEEDDIID